MAGSLQGIVFALTGACWVFPRTVKDVLFSWRDSFVGKKEGKFASLFPFESFGQFREKNIVWLLEKGC